MKNKQHRIKPKPAVNPISTTYGRVVYQFAKDAYVFKYAKKPVKKC